MSFIYKVVNNINGKIYIGKSKINNDSYYGSGLKITAAIKKYGLTNFKKTILEDCEPGDVNLREKYWISFYNSTDNMIGYNISKGGDGGTHYWDTLSEEQKKIHNEKISNSKKGKPHAPHSVNTKKKIRDNQPKDSEWIRQRALKKCKIFTCINHNTKNIYVTKNLKEFCKDYDLSYTNMLYNAKKQKNYTEHFWSCRLGEVHGDVVEIIETQVKNALLEIKNKTGKYNKSGSNNPMFNKKHTIQTKEKMRNIRLGKI